MNLDSPTAGDGGSDGLFPLSEVWRRLFYLFGVVSLRALVGVILWLILVAVIIDPQNGLTMRPSEVFHHPIHLLTSETGVALGSVFVAYWTAVWVYVPVRAALALFYNRLSLAFSTPSQRVTLEDDDE